MIYDIHYNPDHASATMVYRITASMIVRHNMENGWIIEHFYIKITYLHEDYKCGKKMYTKKQHEQAEHLNMGRS